MTVKELKKALENVPEDMDVMIEMISDDGLYGMAEEAVIEKVTFQADGVPKKDWAKIECLVIRD